MSIYNTAIEKRDAQFYALFTACDVRHIYTNIRYLNSLYNMFPQLQG